MWAETAVLDDLIEPRRTTSIQLKRKGIAVQTVAIGNRSSIALVNQRTYCSKWGYHFKVLTKSLDERHPAWQKIPFTLNLFDQGYDHVYWIDGDAFFTICNQSLQPLIDRMEQDNSTWLFSGDTLLINSGQMMWKKMPAARAILIGVDRLWFPKWDSLHLLRDNAAFAAYLTGARNAMGDEIRAAYRLADEQCGYLVSGSREALHAVTDGRRRRRSLETEHHLGPQTCHYQLVPERLLKGAILSITAPGKSTRGDA
eukprot:scaffold336_cov196-Amphora_coffeaeformis.AAC.12